MAFYLKILQKTGQNEERVQHKTLHGARDAKADLTHWVKTFYGNHVGLRRLGISGWFNPERSPPQERGDGGKDGNDGAGDRGRTGTSL